MRSFETVEQQILNLTQALERIKGHEISLAELMEEFSTSAAVYQSVTGVLNKPTFHVVQIKCDSEKNLEECSFDWESL